MSRVIQKPSLMSRLTALLAVMFFFRGRSRYRYRGRFGLSGTLPFLREPHTLAGRVS